MRLLQRIKLTPPSVEIGNAKSTEAMHVDSQIGPLVPNSFVRLVANGQWSSTAVDSRPSVYASGHDTRYGIRVVAAYGNRLVLYSIPPATLVGYDKKISAGGIQDDRSPTDLSVTLGYHPSHAYIRTTFHTYSGARPDSTILGSEIAVVEDLVEVAIDSGPNMTVYAFSSKGFLAIYRLDGLFEKRAKVVWEKLGPRDETSLDPDCKALKENGIEHFEKKEVEKCFRGNTPLKPSAIFEVLANETTYFEGGLDGRATFPLQSTCDYDLLRPPGRDSAENRNHAIEGVKNKEKRKNWITADSATSSSLQQGRLETAYDYYYANLGRTVEIDAICFDEIGIDRDCVDDYDQQEGLLHDWYLGGLGNMRKSPGGCPFRLRRTNALQRGLGIGDIDFWDEESNASSGESWSKIGAGRAGRRWVRLECEVMGL